MTDQPTPPTPHIPDSATRERLRKQLRAASTGLRQSSAEIQAITEELILQYEHSPLGQFHARRKADTTQQYS